MDAGLRFNGRVSLDLIVLVAGIIVCQLAGVVGSVFTMKAIPSWYKDLKKPSFNPPNWLFGPAWLILYTLMGIAAALVWEQGSGSPQVQTALIIFGVQLVLNVLWSVVFFGRRSLGGGLVIIAALWVAILATIFSFWSISTLAAVLLVPYIAWSSFASLLNFYIWKLNPS